MVALIAKGKPSNVTRNVVGVFHRSKEDAQLGYVVDGAHHLTNSPYLLCTLVGKDALSVPSASHSPVIDQIGTLSHLSDGDILAVSPSGYINTIFRSNSTHNALFITDRCNSNCLMCSQPPRNINDLDYYYELNRSLIKLIPKETEVLGITGGEPTLLAERLIDLLNTLYEELPNTEIHMLSNGRAFAHKRFSENISASNSNLVIGIPLYSDYYQDHDYIVQAKNAFNQTVNGLHNLARHDARIELRVVLHNLTYKRLPSLAKFIFKNFPFAGHVAFMGLEYIGYTPHNHDRLWIEPSSYMAELSEAISYLDQMGMNVSIYNLQLCLLPEHLWKFSRKSISDWKRDYLEECKKCRKLDDCGGLFATSKILSNEIKAIPY